MEINHKINIFKTTQKRYCHENCRNIHNLLSLHFATAGPNKQLSIKRQKARPYGNMGLYQDISTEPIYWFGHGLSYTNYSYGEVKLSATKIRKNEKLIAEVVVENTGEKSGKETLHWYIADPVCSISRPMKELKYFEKKDIKPSENAVFRFEIDPVRDLSYTNEKGDRLLETGEFFVIVNDQRVKFEVIE